MLRERSFAHRGGIACRMGEQDLTWEEPVSYTHLTLPTT